MAQPTPTRDPQLWAAFNTRFSRLLKGTPTLCFWLVVAGSVYGIQKSIQAQHPEVGILIAAVVAWVVQSVNGVSVHFSTRMIASLFAGTWHRQNTHQRVAGVDYLIGVLCLLFTASICMFDFRANKQAAEKAAHAIVERPDSLTVDTEVNAQAISAAQLAVSAAEAAEAAERRTYEAGIDAKYSAQRSKLTRRNAQLAAIKGAPTWAQNELRANNRRLRDLEAERAQQKRAFTPKTSNVAGAQNDLARISGENSRILLNKTAVVDSTNTANRGAYLAKKDNFSMAIFWLYIVFMLLWHLCEAMKQYRALLFDEQQPDTENPLLAIATSIRDGLNNAGWKINARILHWLPEDEIHGVTRPEILARANTVICHDVFKYILENPGVNEMIIYTHFRDRHEIDSVRDALRVLKTAKLVFENSHLWSADQTQAKFFTAPATNNQQSDPSIFNPESFSFT